MTTKEKILETAITLFAERGYNDVSVRDITREVGIKESSLYNHFSSKQKILEAIYEDLIKNFETATVSEEVIARMIEKMTPEEFLTLSAENFDRYLGDPRLIKIWRIISIERFRDERANAFFKKYLIDNALEYQSKVFDIMMKKGLIKAHDPRVVARESYAFMIFIYFRYLEMEKEVDIKEVKQMVLEHMKFLSSALQK
ncbi:MAG: TetR/AcrR family transcriptional regulator [Clostridia bacterium]|nr:TetR/AcrR family transcriptional regulator [Clostridia bacterium]